MLSKPSLMRSYFRSVQRKNYVTLPVSISQYLSSLLMKMRMRHSHFHHLSQGMRQGRSLTLCPCLRLYDLLRLGHHHFQRAHLLDREVYRFLLEDTWSLDPHWILHPSSHGRAEV
jgi:hypothetical protein